MLIIAKELKFFTKPQEISIQLLQDENILVNNLNYYPYLGA